MATLPSVKLTRRERKQLLAIGRAAGDMESAAEAMTAELLEDGRWEHVPATVISDYGWAAARFCFPSEARSW